jgi:hypothetical protein
MFTADYFRAKAAECATSLKFTSVASEISTLQRSMQNFSQLAENEDLLAENFDKMIKSQDVHPQADASDATIDRRAAAEIEQHILRCLGAAVIMQWKTIPTKLQRELFDTAGSLGDLLKTSALRGQIARFLHEHKDDGAEPAALLKSPQGLGAGE